MLANLLPFSIWLYNLRGLKDFLNEISSTFAMWLLIVYILITVTSIVTCIDFFSIRLVKYIKDSNCECNSL